MPLLPMIRKSRFSWRSSGSSVQLPLLSPSLFLLMSSTKPLGTLMSDSVEFFKTHLTALLVGAVIFGVVSFGLGWWLMGSAFQSAGMQPRVTQWQQQMQDIGSRMEDLQKKAAGGQTDAA